MTGKRSILELLEKAKRSKGTSKGQSPYEKGLRLYWAGDTSKCIEFLTDFLARKPFHRDSARLYRLWIEVLCEDQDQASLSALEKHLEARCLAGQESGDYFSLRGIIHLELGKNQAADLFASASSKRMNSYGNEIRQKQALRKCLSDTYPLIESISTSKDYFHFRELALYAYLTGQEEIAQKVIALGQVRFPKSPLREVFQFHVAYQDEDYVLALSSASALTDLYPNHPTYSFYLGYLQLLSGDYEKAVVNFQKSLDNSKDQEPETVSLLSFCYEKLARKYSVAAEVVRRSSGVPTTHLRDINLHSQKEETFSAGMRELNCWFVDLNDVEYSLFLKDSFKDKNRILSWNLGTEVRSGDLVFFGTRSGPSSAWRIAAAYQSVSGPLWHPLLKSETFLQECSRLPISVSINLNRNEDVEVSDSNQKVFKFKESAQEVLIELLTRLNQGEDSNFEDFDLIEAK